MISFGGVLSCLEEVHLDGGVARETGSDESRADGSVRVDEHVETERTAEHEGGCEQQRECEVARILSGSPRLHERCVMSPTGRMLDRRRRIAHPPESTDGPGHVLSPAVGSIQCPG